MKTTLIATINFFMVCFCLNAMEEKSGSELSQYMQPDGIPPITCSVKNLSNQSFQVKLQNSYDAHFSIFDLLSEKQTEAFQLLIVHKDVYHDPYHRHAGTIEITELPSATAGNIKVFLKKVQINSSYQAPVGESGKLCLGGTITAQQSTRYGGNHTEKSFEFNVSLDQKLASVALFITLKKGCFQTYFTTKDCPNLDLVTAEVVPS
jgi:hypothetical protein